MLPTVERTITENDLIHAGDIVLVGVSGGPDSVALFHCLLRLRGKLDFEIAVCHLNHHIRGKESDEDARFTRNLVKKFGIRFFSGNASIVKKKRSGKGSVEEIARNERYKFYCRTARKCGAGKMALGHTSDDNVETFLINLLRGSGLKGLSGIPVKRAEGDLEIIRPLLDVSKSQILEYLKKEGLRYRIDSTNRDVSYTRNRIRLRLLPYLRRNYNPKIDEVIQNTSRYLRYFADYMRDELIEITDSIVRKLDNGFSMSLTDYMSLHPSLRSLLIRELFETFFGIAANEELLAQVRSLTQQKGRYRVTLPNKVTGFLEYETLRFTRGRSRKVAGLVRRVPIPSNTILPEWNLAIETSLHKAEDLRKGFQAVKKEAMGRIWHKIASGNAVTITEYLDADLVGADELTFRPKRPGDKYRPLGKGGTHTLKKLFIDEKVPISLRERVPVVVASGRIIYVPGYRVSDDVRIVENTCRVMKLNMTIFPL